MASQRLAFGVEPANVSYRLRLSRYHALAESVARYVQSHPERGRRPLRLLDAGTGGGRSRRYIAAQLAEDDIEYHGVDRFSLSNLSIYKQESWTLYDRCLEKGLPFLDSDTFDIVICEQVLEHLTNAESTAKELVRVLRPGGLLIAGVPTFPHGVHLIRKHLVPLMDRCTDRWFGVKKQRGHVQAFSARTFRRMVLNSGDVSVSELRGFRILSGGPLRPLENFRWFWRLNRLIGSMVPGLCIEIQVLATKASASAPTVQDSRAQSTDRHRAA